MATQVTGRKRIPNREKLSAEDDALSLIAREVRQMNSISRGTVAAALSCCAKCRPFTSAGVLQM